MGNDVCHSAGYEAATNSAPMSNAELMDDGVTAGICALTGHNDAYANGYQEGYDERREAAYGYSYNNDG